MTCPVIRSLPQVLSSRWTAEPEVISVEVEIVCVLISDVHKWKQTKDHLEHVVNVLYLFVLFKFFQEFLVLLSEFLHLLKLLFLSDSGGFCVNNHLRCSRFNNKKKEENILTLTWNFKRCSSSLSLLDVSCFSSSTGLFCNWLRR